MARTLFMNGDAEINTQNFGVTNYRPIAGNCGTTATEANTQQPIQAAGTFNNMSVSVQTNTVNGTTTVRFRKGAANGNQTLTVSSSTTGHFQDLVNTDSVTAGNLVNYSTVTAGTSGTFSPVTMSSTFDTTTPTTLSVTRLAITSIGAGASGYTAASTTFFKALAGWLETNASVTEANSQFKMQYAGTFKNFAVRLISNSRTTTTTYRVRKNTANSTVTVAFGSTATGLVQDTTNSFTVVAGDLVCYSIVNGTGTLATGPGTISVEYHSTTDPGLGQIILARGGAQALTRATTYYQPISGSYDVTGTNQTEVLLQTKVGEPWLFKGLATNVSQNSITPNASTVTLRKNGADTTLVASITAATTGWFQDTTHTETVAVGDLLCYGIVTGTGSGTQTVTIRSIGMTTEMPGATAIDMTPNMMTVNNKVITKI